MTAQSLYWSPQGCAAVQRHYDNSLQRWQIPYQSHTVPTRFGHTHVLAAGDSALPPLLLFHGWGSSAADLYHDLNLPLLAGHYRLLCPDIIGHTGRSAPTRLATRGSACGLWVSDLMDALHVERAHVVGISGGGFMALKAAAHAPHRVLRAFVISTAGLAHLIPGPSVLLRAAAALLHPSDENVRRFMQMASAPHHALNARHDESLRGLRLTLRHHRYQPLPPRLHPNELRGISAPVYVLMGKHDALCHTAHSVRFARHIPAVTVEVLPQAGHTLTKDIPGLAEQRLLAFLR